MESEDHLFIEPLLRDLGRYLIDKQKSVGGIKAKGPLDLVTEADFEVERRLKESISKRFPEDMVLAEEKQRIQPESLENSRVWIIDPLDGTVNYASGWPLFCISVGLAENGKPKAGWVYCPVLDELYAAEDHQGAYLNGYPICLKDNEAPGLISLSSGFLSALDHLPTRGLVPWMELGKMRNIGSQALQLCWVATGRLSLAVNWESKIWDDFAGALILKEAGGHYESHGSEWLNDGLLGAVLDPENALQSVANHPSLCGKIKSLLNKTIWRSHEARCY